MVPFSYIRVVTQKISLSVRYIIQKEFPQTLDFLTLSILILKDRGFDLKQ
ncbi:hypothetical protein LEP1GSC158_4287 [Leptospira interrogans serovar Zanoni str. LT2156]|uniref:Uncharacterized protein n=1 Tax=Leptospira interrogans serovar Zanoni str. LT2156 TaxID=1001601 RepID=M6HE89_LEPIR|nr:hypothetical protein LEP1GSC158_4287 [Leptospira interrogans serovar Zanoni str. LT2156]